MTAPVDAAATTTVTVGTLAWSGAEANPDHATYGEALTVEIPLTAVASGYELAGDLTAEDIAFTADMGWEATAVTYSRDGLTATVTATVTVQEAEITALMVDLTKPTAGDPLVETTTVSGLTPNTATATATVSWEGDVRTPGQATTGE